MTGLAVKYTTGSVGNNTVFVTGSMAEAMTSVGLSGAGRRWTMLSVNK